MDTAWPMPLQQQSGVDYAMDHASPGSSVSTSVVNSPAGSPAANAGKKRGPKPKGETMRNADGSVVTPTGRSPVKRGTYRKRGTTRKSLLGPEGGRAPTAQSEDGIAMSSRPSTVIEAQALGGASTQAENDGSVAQAAERDDGRLDEGDYDDEDGENYGDDDDDHFLPRRSGQDQEAIEAEQAEARAKEGLLINSHMSEEQLARYEAYRRGGLSRPIVRRYFNTVLNLNVSATMTPFIAGATKVFIGEMIELARKVQAKSLDDDALGTTEREPLSPEDIREAWRLYQRMADRKLPVHRKRFFIH